MPDLSALEMLVAVARSGSVNSAARELGRTQQGVSSRLAGLETQVGVPLILRSPRGSTLTPSGTVVVEWATRLLDQAAEMDAGLATLRADTSAHLQVAASLTVAERLLPGWLVALNESARRHKTGHVDVTLTATNSEAVAHLVRAGAVDIGFVEGPTAPNGCRSRVIAHDHLVLVVPPHHPWASVTRRITPELLARTPLVSREPGSGTRDALHLALSTYLTGRRPIAEPALQLSTTAAVRAAVLAGAGPAVLSALVVADDIALGRLRAVPVRGLALGRALRAIWSGPRNAPPGPARRLVEIATSAHGRADL